MSDEMKMVVVGAAGRMGRMLVAQVTATPGCILCGATERPDSPAVGQDAGSLAGINPLEVHIAGDAAPAIAHADAVLDFTSPQSTLEHARLAAQAGAAHIIGTTGLEAQQTEELQKAAHHVPVVWAPNFSAGVTLLMSLSEQVARILGDDYDIEILEMHHHHKVDAPSGTALGLGQAAARGREVEHDDVKEAARDGHTGARRRGDIGYAVLRGGDVIGEHSVIFAGDGERVELTHKATSRQVFAAGAVRAALWARDRKAGLYTMKDVLGLEG